MGEEDIRARQDSIDSHILALSTKIDDYRKELMEALMEYHKSTRETHKRLYARVDSIEDEIRALKVEQARLTPVIQAMQKHMDNDVPVDVARDKAVARGVFYVLGLGVSGFIGWLFSHFGGRQ